MILAELILAEGVATAEEPPNLAGAAVTFSIAGTDAQPLPCRIHLWDEDQQPQRPPDLPFWHDHFVCEGEAQLSLTPGRYTYWIERGPEYTRHEGEFLLADQPRTIRVTLPRITSLAEKHWFSGDLHIHRPVDQIERLMRAEDLHVGPVITWWNDRNPWQQQPLPERTHRRFDENRYFDVLAGEDEREGGALLFFNLKQPLPLAGASAEHPSPMQFVRLARQQDDVWIDIEKPFWWDVPIWLASGQIDSIGLANNHMCHRGMLENEAWGRPRDPQRLPPPRGNGIWSQEIYYQILNAGLRIPPSAGSASGVLPNPVGYNRVYVHTGPDFDYASWWRSLKAGRVVVTNGPLLLCRANGQLPGHVFRKPGADKLAVEIELQLLGNDRVPAIELIRNGEVARRIPVDQDSGSVATARLHFTESGWFLVRAIADNQETFRFASTGPFYVELGTTQRRISRAAAEFFLSWVNERAARVGNKLADRRKLEEVLAHHREARSFWQARIAAANAP